LQAALAPISSAGAKLSTYDSGLHLVVEFDDHIDDVRIAQMAAEKGLNVYPLSNYCLNNQIEKGLIIGYAYAPTDKITPSGNQLAQVICKVLAESKS
jgi:GntR family transcriptional regulator/MocR family aminotransferase